MKEDVLQVADPVVNLSAKTVIRQNTPIDLTAREFILLEYRWRVVSKMDLSVTYRVD